MTGQVSKQMYKYLCAPKAGVKKPTALKVARLAAYAAGEVKLTKAELAKWKRLQVVDENGQVKMVDPNGGVEWIMIALIYEGLVLRKPMVVKA